MIEIKQMVTSDYCLTCKGCCRFRRPDTVWSPGLLEEDVKNIMQHNLPASCITPDKRIRLMGNPRDGNFICSFLNTDDNTCAIYTFRPFECRLYPLVLNRRAEKIFLAVDANCPLADEKLRAADAHARREWEAYVAYCAGILTTPAYAGMLRDNPHIVQEYTDVVDMKELPI